ncbi:glycoside hydrolase family 28 protein [Rhodobacteraceae bacterium]|nr:glycoside hydrolase family 28 protein [Paracoccaceae bacterium]
MDPIRIVALGARMAVLCLAPAPQRYTLEPAQDWQLFHGTALVQQGHAATTILPLGGLAPDTDYLFCADGRELRLRTAPCPGMVDIADMGARSGAPDTAQTARENADCVMRAIAALPQGGTLMVPAGHWICAPVQLRSDMVLHLAEGAVLAAPSDRTGWPILPAQAANGTMLGSWEGVPAKCYRAPLHAIGAARLTIEGLGTLDGGGDRGDWWTWPKDTREGARRPRGLHLVDCHDVQLLGFTIRNAPSWTIHPQGCHTLLAAGLRIEAPADSPNTDGFDPEMCSDLVLRGLHFSVGDDCIAIKAGKRGPDGAVDHLRESARIAISQCRMERGHGGVVIGSEMSGDVSDIHITDCEMAGTDRGLRLKTRRGRGGRIDAITMSNVTMDGVHTAFSANAHYHCDPDGHDDWVQSRSPREVDDATPAIGRITIDAVEIQGLCHALGAFLGLPEAPIGPIELSNIRVVSHNPDAVAGHPVMADHIRPQRHAGIMAEYAQIITDLAVEQRPLSQHPHPTPEPPR